LGASGENTDIGAHLFGFVSGIGLGFMSEFFTQKYDHRQKQANRGLAILATSLVVAAWDLALMVGR